MGVFVKNDVPMICHICGEMVPVILPEGSMKWHPPIPRSEGQWMASVEGVGVHGMSRCSEPPNVFMAEHL